MTGTKYKISVAAALLASSVVFGSSWAKADTILGSETDAGGFTGSLFANSPGYVVASDGEANFDPFGFGGDTSDGIDFSAVAFVWTQASDSFWTQLGGAAPVQTWVLPADLTSFGCGTENGTTCEPVGHFLSATPWNPGFTGTFDILDSLGNISDVIILDNTAGGQAELWFYSDPTFPAPEPITLSLFGAGLAGSVALRRRKKKTA